MTRIPDHLVDHPLVQTYLLWSAEEGRWYPRCYRLQVSTDAPPDSDVEQTAAQRLEPQHSYTFDRETEADPYPIKRMGRNPWYGPDGPTVGASLEETDGAELRNKLTDPDNEAVKRGHAVVLVHYSDDRYITSSRFFHGPLGIVKGLKCVALDRLIDPYDTLYFHAAHSAHADYDEAGVTERLRQEYAARGWDLPDDFDPARYLAACKESQAWEEAYYAIKPVIEGYVDQTHIVLRSPSSMPELWK